VRTIIQRVEKASVTINGKIKSEIEQGLLILLGIEVEDSTDDVKWLTSKIAQMRIFPDKEKKMNLSVKDIIGEVLVVSQFTLHASIKKGNRPSFIRAASPQKALKLYNSFVNELNFLTGNKVKSGEFGAMMDVTLINSGPVTIFVDSKSKE